MLTKEDYDDETGIGCRIEEGGADLPSAQNAKTALESFIDILGAELASSGKVTVAGLGTFKVVSRAARKERTRAREK